MQLLEVVQRTMTAEQRLDSVEWYGLREQLVVLRGSPGESLRWTCGQKQARSVMILTTSLGRATTSWWSSVARGPFPEK